VRNTLVKELNKMEKEFLINSLKEQLDSLQTDFIMDKIAETNGDYLSVLRSISENKIFNNITTHTPNVKQIFEEILSKRLNKPVKIMSVKGVSKIITDEFAYHYGEALLSFEHLICDEIIGNVRLDSLENIEVTEEDVAEIVVNIILKSKADRYLFND